MQKHTFPDIPDWDKDGNRLAALTVEVQARSWQQHESVWSISEGQYDQEVDTTYFELWAGDQESLNRRCRPHHLWVDGNASEAEMIARAVQFISNHITLH